MTSACIFVICSSTFIILILWVVCKWFQAIWSITTSNGLITLILLSLSTSAFITFLISWRRNARFFFARINQRYFIQLSWAGALLRNFNSLDICLFGWSHFFNWLQKFILLDIRWKWIMLFNITGISVESANISSNEFNAYTYSYN